MFKFTEEGKKYLSENLISSDWKVSEVSPFGRITISSESLNATFCRVSLLTPFVNHHFLGKSEDRLDISASGELSIEGESQLVFIGDKFIPQSKYEFMKELEKKSKESSLSAKELIPNQVYKAKNKRRFLYVGRVSIRSGRIYPGYITEEIRETGHYLREVFYDNVISDSFIKFSKSLGFKELDTSFDMEDASLQPAGDYTLLREAGEQKELSYREFPNKVRNRVKPLFAFLKDTDSGLLYMKEPKTQVMYPTYFEVSMKTVKELLGRFETLGDSRYDYHWMMERSLKKFTTEIRNVRDDSSLVGIEFI